MDSSTFTRANIRFTCSQASIMPEIPRVQDVLYALRLSDKQEFYVIGRSNHEIYNINVHLAAAACVAEVLSMRPFDEKAALRIIASAIIELCPDDAKCLFHGSYLEAKRLIGEDIDLTMTRSQLQNVCGCTSCRASVSQEERSLAGE